MGADSSSKLESMPTWVLAFYAHNNLCLGRVTYFQSLYENTEIKNDYGIKVFLCQFKFITLSTQLLPKDF